MSHSMFHSANNQSHSSPHLSAAVFNQALQTFRLKMRLREIIESEPPGPDELPAAAFRILSELPARIVSRSSRSGNSMCVMKLSSGRDFAAPGVVRRLFGVRLTLTELSDVSAAVYKYCEKNGLQPQLGKYSRSDSGSFDCDMNISWPSSLHADLARSANAAAIPESERVPRALKTLMPITRPTGLVARARLSNALVLMPLVLHELEQAARADQSLANVYGEKAPANLPPPDTVAEINEFCQRLGLQSEVVAFDTDEGFKKRFQVVVSGWADAQPLDDEAVAD